MQNNKTVYLMRGIPGSGKSFRAKEIAAAYPPGEASICSADNYFVVDGVYHFDRTKLDFAHGQCKRNFEMAIKLGKSCIIVDNTNLTKKIYSYYENRAVAEGYCVELVQPTTSWALDVDECFKRNQHGVPLENLKKMLELFQKG